MSNLQPPWNQYLALQSTLRDSNTVDDLNWGREAALNRILASDLRTGVDEIERAAKSESRGERYRAGLRRKYLSREEPVVDVEAVVQARQRLRIVKAATTEDEWALLGNIGEGSSYQEIAAASGASAGALRVRVRRAREKLNALAA
jgi:DNA-directed RNA polymerase specialized sigma24 family protein